MSGETKDVYIYKSFEQNLLKDFKSLRFCTGWGEHCHIPVGEDGKVNKEFALAESHRVFAIAQKLVKTDMIKEKENIKLILNVDDKQFEEMIK